MTIHIDHLPDGVHGWLFPPRVDIFGGTLKSMPFVLARPAYFYSQVLDRWIAIPAGFGSDLQSIPWLFRRCFPPSGHGRQAAIVHDWLCDDRPDWCSSEQAHAVFNEAMILEDVPTWERRIKYVAVRRWGPKWTVLEQENHK